MAVSFNYIGNATNGTTAIQTQTVAGGSYTGDGRRICVISTAEQANHTNGLDTEWAISDTGNDVTGNDITWTPLHTSTILDNGNNDSQLRVWISSPLTANETFDVTVDPYNGGTSTFRIRTQVCEVIGSDGTLDKVDSDSATSTLSISLDLGLTNPSKGQLLIAFRFAPGTHVWDGAPTDFSKPTGAENTHTTLMTSTTNTDATITYGSDTATPKFLVHLEFNESAVTMAVPLATETDTAFDPDLPVVFGVPRADETDTTFDPTVGPQAVVMAVPLAEEADSTFDPELPVVFGVPLAEETDTTFGPTLSQGSVIMAVPLAEETNLTFPPSFLGQAKPVTNVLTFDIEAAVTDPVTQYHRRVDVYESDGTTLWMRGAGLVGGSVTVDMGGSARRSCDLTLFNQDGELDYDRVDGFWYDKVFKVVVGVESDTTIYENPIGTFVIDRVGSENMSSEIELSLRDFSAKLNFELPFAVSWPTNEPIENIISDLATGGGVPSGWLNLPLTGINTGAERAFTAGTDRWRAMTEVANANGYDLYFDAAGVLQMTTFTDPATDPPQFVFRVGLGSNVASIGRQISPDLIRNHIVVTGEAPDGSPVWGEAFNWEPNSPTNITRLGYRTRTIETSWVTSDAQAVSLAESQLRFESLERYEADLGTILVPWLDVNVTVDFDDPAGQVSDPTRFLLNKVVIPLDLGIADARVARVTNVIAEPALYPSLTTYPGSTTFPGNGP